MKKKNSLIKFGWHEPGFFIGARTRSSHRAEIEEKCRIADKKGWTNFLLGSHALENATWESPIPMLGKLARQSKRIQVGVAGLNPTSLGSERIAKSFTRLSKLFPGRISLGLNRLHAPTPEAHAAHQAEITIIHRRLTGREHHVPLWFMGTSGTSFQDAVRIDANYIHGLTDRSQNLEDKLSAARNKGWNGEFAVCVYGICSESPAELRPAQEFFKTNATSATVLGSISEWEKRLFEISKRWNPNRIIISDISYSTGVGIRSIENLSKIIGRIR
jgi:alkanesulfonate monooxygenase SsuD/methylene tetrahydromethanopterin reductase-like flavin-dependent oxidoreductase (luciferase family)